MGQTSSSASSGVKAHMETAEKTGALVLTDRKLVEVPDLSSLSSVLRTLDLSYNKLEALPPSLQSLSHLRHLSANSNRLELISNQLGTLRKLESLSLMNNRLVKLPESFAQLKHLKSLILSYNQISEFPIAVCGLPHLDVLDLTSNKIKKIPKEIETLQALELNLNQNQLQVISPSIAKCPRLKTLRMEENSLELSSIPEELLTESEVSLLCVNGNLFYMKNLEDMPIYAKYMERYTAVKKKML